MSTPPSEPEWTLCALCNEPCNAHNDWCRGCKAYVCEECDQNPHVTGTHTPEEHTHWPEGEP